MKKKKKISRRTYRSLLFLLSMLYAFVVLVGSTYAWFTMADTRINRVDTQDVAIQIKVVGELGPLNLTTHVDAKRNVAVRNFNTTPALVRVSLKEVLLAFEIDTIDRTGNANLKEYSGMEGKTAVEPLNSDTWQITNRYYESEKNRYYQPVARETYTYLSSLAGRPEFLSYLNLVFSNRLLAGNPAPGDPIQDHYWIYQDGYFYYSEKLLKDETSSVLLEKVSLQNTAPNEMKGSLYKLHVKAEGGIPKNAIFDAWGVTSGTPAYEMLQKQIY